MIFNMVGGGIDTYATICITGLLETDTVTATNASLTRTGTWIASESKFELKDITIGTWSVTATSGSKSKTISVVVDAVTTYNIAWTWGLILYDHGDECEAITGGFTIYKSSGGIVTKNADNIYFKVSSQNHEASIYTTNSVDFSLYTKLFAEVSDLALVHASPLSGFRFGTGTQYYGGWNRPGIITGSLPASSFNVCVLSSISPKNQTIKLAINNGGTYTDSTSEFSVYKIWLEE